VHSKSQFSFSSFGYSQFKLFTSRGSIIRKVASKEDRILLRRSKSFVPHAYGILYFNHIFIPLVEACGYNAWTWLRHLVFPRFTVTYQLIYLFRYQIWGTGNHARNWIIDRYDQYILFPQFILETYKPPHTIHKSHRHVPNMPWLYYSGYLSEKCEKRNISFLIPVWDSCLTIGLLCLVLIECRQIRPTYSPTIYFWGFKDPNLCLSAVSTAQ